MFSLLKKITHLWSVQGTGIIQNVHCTVVEKGPHSSHLVWCYQIHHVYSKDMNRMPFRPTCILWLILPLFFIHVSPFLLCIFLVTIVLLHQCLSLETSHLKSFHLLELVTRYCKLFLIKIWNLYQVKLFIVYSMARTFRGLQAVIRLL